MSCSSKRKIAVGSCMSTLVSSTYSRRVAMLAAFTSQRLRRFEHFQCVTLDLDAAPLPAQHALGVDQKCAALDAQHFASVQVFFPDDVEQPAHLLVGVGQQGERITHLVAEFLVRGEAVARDAEDGG